MKTFQNTKIAKDLGVTHGAVSQWFSGETIPKYRYMLEMSRKHNIPFTAWEDIKSYMESVQEKEHLDEVQKV
ncbi:Cro/CI family transcriptional regulator [Halarcobacter sp.]|uniref:Cro/CI family transcriptional regulator n=1 Tax=Halarcobacter sp. TaxID=2321133 RepID=UPI003A8FC4F6